VGVGPPAVSPARVAAHRVLVRVLAEGAYADRALHSEARDLGPRDRSLAKQLAFGTVQRRLTLDHVIARRTDRELEPGVRAALQLGLFQLLFLDVADHAAVGEAVELAKPSPGHRLVNAVLRGVQRDGAELPSDATPKGAAIRHSHPEWLVRMWWDQLGADETRALLAADNEPAELALRVNTLAAGARLDDVPGRREGDTIVVDGPFDAFAHPGWAAGWFTPQSRASQRVAPALAPRPGERVLDLCAAPGGKTTHLAALMQGEGEVVAVERHAGRAQALRRTCARLRATNVTVVCADATAYRDERGFDRVLLDPPCSGLGTLRSHPDLRWRASAGAIARLAALQDALLQTARAALRPGGSQALVFSVCTISRAEERLRGTSRWRTLPHRDGTDGFYIARDGG
jgi:16S rRNA (cytosine967-C5)-methyltransferase